MAKKKKKKLTDDQLKKRRDAAFAKKIRSIFLAAGFSHLNTRNKTFHLGHRDIEIDSVFMFENIIIIAEDTSTKNDLSDYIRRKSQAFLVIKNNLQGFLAWLSSVCPDHSQQIEKYTSTRFRTFNLYFSQHDLELNNEQRQLYPEITFVEPHTLEYLYQITQCLQLTSRYEIFRFLGVSKDQVGRVCSDNDSKTISTPIIYPTDFTGQQNGVRIVSFMMSADILLKCCYVMRKDNWEDFICNYQRLILVKKIRDIRRFLAKKGETFYNNIIVSLPDSVRFSDKDKNTVSIETINDLCDYDLVLPTEWNSICVIDGQHRIFAHYEGNATDELESRIAPLRSQLHLLVTGLIFPKDMPSIERAQIQSEIFLDINSKSSPVPAEVITHIEMVKSPYSDIGLARRVIEALNREGVFAKKLEVSSIDDSKLKVASIIKFALRYLVTLTPSENRVSLFDYWTGDKEKFHAKDESAFDEYIGFCVKSLNCYFGAVRKCLHNAWYDPNAKLLSVISINGFIIAFTRQLKKNGIKDFAFYEQCFSELDVDFSRENFAYTSSQYRKFSSEILAKAFGFSPDEL